MRLFIEISAWFLATMLLGVSGRALAAEASVWLAPTDPKQGPPVSGTEGLPDGDATPEVEEAEEGPVLTFDVGVGSAYIWRGANLWGRRTSTQHLSLFPGVTYANGSFTAFYWGAYQLSGTDKGVNLDRAVGAEQDLGITYSLSLTKQLSVVPFITLYWWPLATRAVTNTTVTFSLEPGCTFAYEASWANWGFAASYYRGLSDYTDAYSHVYLTPTIGKDLELNERWALNLAASAGYKRWTNHVGADADENDVDVQGNVGLTYDHDDVSVVPAMHASWTNIAGDAVAIWGTVNVSYDLGL